jgi:diguanylate cyclase (GGDEF)-like protein
MTMAHSKLPMSQTGATPPAEQNPPTLIPPKTIRILLAGDVTGEAAQAVRALFSQPEHALELTTVSSVATLIPTLGVFSPEIIVLDLGITQPQHKEMVRRVHRAAPHIPLILFGDHAQKELAKEVLSEGAMDYFLREFMDPATLSRVFRGALERNTIEGLADLLRDPVTDLYTRDGLLTIGSRIMDLTRRNAGTLALFCVFVHDLEGVRDKLGTAGVDEALKEVTTALIECFRRSDILARLGEAQFAILAVDTTEQGVTIVRQRLDRRLARLTQQRDSRGSLRFTVNGRTWSATENVTFAELLDTVESGLRASADDLQVMA